MKQMRQRAERVTGAKRQRLRRLGGFLVLMLGLLGSGGAAAQSALSLMVTHIDTAEFPTVQLLVRSEDGLRNPVNLANLSLRENGAPVSEFTSQAVPVGVDVVFVLDANAGFGVDDGGGMTRAAIAAESVTTFANRFMNPTGLDRVSVIVPGVDGENGRFLLEDETQPDALRQAMANYAPQVEGLAPLQEMMTQAIDHLAARTEDGRFQAILLLSDAGEINTQLQYQPLVAAAQAIDLPIYAAILGVQATFAEVDNVELLTEPTRARWVHLPSGDRTDSIYLTWSGQGVQQQLTYVSALRQSGEVRLSVNLGDVLAQAAFELVVLPPTVAIDLPGDVIERTAAAFDTPLAEMVPLEVVVPLALTWPDGRPREVVAATLTVNGQVQPPPAELVLDENGRLLLPWNIANLDEDVYELAAAVVDAYGYEASSDSFLLALSLLRPDPPTPTPMVTPTPIIDVPLPPVEEIPTLAESVVDWLRVNWQIWTPLVGGLLLLWLLRLVWRRWRARRQAAAAPPSKVESPPPPLPAVPQFAYLEPLDAPPDVPLLALEADSLTLGRDTAVAQLVLDDTSLSRLHARIRRIDGVYWLYDEGSASGTLLNFERLGLAPRQLANGDTVQLGRVRLRFLLVDAPLVVGGDEEE